MTIAVSVVIPMHNGAEFILQQLDGLSESIRDVANTEIIVVDNRSTDSGPALVRQWALSTGVAAHVVGAHEKAGEPFARNIGWRAARGDVILFCDADDVVSPGWVKALARALTEHGYATGPLDTSLLNDPRIADIRGQALFRALPTLTNGIPFAHGCNMGFRRDVLEGLGGFDESFLIACDVEIAVRAWQQGIHPEWAPEALVHYRLRPTVAASYRQSRAYARARRRIDSLVTGSPGRVDWRHQGRRTVWLVRHMPQTVTFGGRMRWSWVAGQVVGELQGRRPWN